MMTLVEQYFKLLGWKRRKATKYLHPTWISPDGTILRLLPRIETDYNAFFKWVVKEMRKRGYYLNFDLGIEKTFAQITKDGEVLAYFLSSSFQIAGIEAAIKVLEAKE